MSTETDESPPRLFEPGDRVVDVETGARGVVVERVTIGQLHPDRRPYPHVYDVAYDDRKVRRRMAYHLAEETK